MQLYPPVFVSVMSVVSHHLHTDVGSITLIMGPMFAGKTTELMRQVKRLIYARRTCCVIKYARDARYHASDVVSHDQQHLKANVALSVLSDFGDEWKEYDAIAIDEGQFFPDLADWCNRCADAGKHVVVSALDGDYLRRPFGDIVRLIPLCENLIKVKAICMLCHQRDASFTRRTVQSNEQELIGGAEMYVAACRECYSAPTSQFTPRKTANYRQAVRTIEALTALTLVDEAAATTSPTDPQPEGHIKSAAAPHFGDGVKSSSTDRCRTPEAMPPQLIVVLPRSASDSPPS